MTTIRLICVLMLCTTTVWSQSKTGTSIGQFLLIEPSARIAAMGNAGVTVAGDIQSAYYNPAAIGYVTGYEVQFTHSIWLADIAYNYAAVALPIEGMGNFSLSVTSLNSGEIAVRTVERPLGTGEMYTVADLAIGIGYGRQISNRFSVGVQLNYVQETIWHTSMSAFGLNVGTLYMTDEDGLLIGASVSNFGTRGEFDGRDLRIQYDRDPDQFGDNSALPASQFVDDYPLPIIFRLGLGYPLKFSEGNLIRFAVDAFHPSDNTESVSFGAEWMFEQTFFLRGGYQNLFLEDSEVGLTLGAGIRTPFDVYHVGIDYAWADHGRLTETHRLTLGVIF